MPVLRRVGEWSGKGGMFRAKELKWALRTRPDAGE